MLRRYLLALIFISAAPLAIQALTQNQFAGLLLSLNLDNQGITWDDANKDETAQREEISGASPEQLFKIFNYGRAISTADYNEYLANCVRSREYNKAVELIEHDADPNTLITKDYRVLVWFIEEKKESIVNLLIKKGADVNIDGGVPLFEAVYWSRTKIVESLLSAGADANGVNSAPLAAACSNKNLEIVKMLIAAGADVNHGNGASLVAACTAQDTEIVRTLIGARADVNLGNGAAVIAACSSQSVEITKVLIEARANVNLGDGTALLSACSHQNIEIVKMLLAAGARVNVHSKKYPSPEAAAMDFSNSGGDKEIQEKGKEIVRIIKEERERTAKLETGNEEKKSPEITGETSQKSEEYERGKTDGEYAANTVNFFNGSFYLAGIGILGLFVAPFAPIDIPAESIEGQTEDYVKGFIDGYSPRERFSYMFSACLGTITIVGVTAGIVCVYILVEGSFGILNGCLSKPGGG